MRLSPFYYKLPLQVLAELSVRCTRAPLTAACRHNLCLFIHCQTQQPTTLTLLLVLL